MFIQILYYTIILSGALFLATSVIRLIDRIDRPQEKTVRHTKPAAHHSEQTLVVFSALSPYPIHTFPICPVHIRFIHIHKTYTQYILIIKPRIYKEPEHRHTLYTHYTYL